MITCLPGINMKASCVFMQIYWLDRDTGQKEGIWNATFGHNYNQCLLTRYARNISFWCHSLRFSCSNFHLLLSRELATGYFRLLYGQPATPLKWINFAFLVTFSSRSLFFANNSSKIWSVRLKTLSLPSPSKQNGSQQKKKMETTRFVYQSCWTC